MAMFDPTFELLRSRRIESLNLEVQEYRHRGTGARHLHLAADDSNNAFVVAFLTLPQDSTGIAHILEHTVLCGSKRFPVRDPFFMMNRRSLSTFMNAMTSSDWTAYPFATQSRKDFDNLLQVYLDAVFFPQLNELDFAQEGYRVEFEVPSDPTTNLVYKGVVYNEMRGAMSSPVARLWQTLSAELFPTTPYRYNSGGEPEAIPNLSFEQLRAFHARYYHPSNAFLATYGNFPVAEHQAHFHEWALKYFEARPIDFRIPDEMRYPSPRSITVPYALEEGGDTRDKTHIVLGWLLGNTIDLKQTMHARLLEGVLLDHSACPLRQVLETTPLGTAPSELCGLETATREAVFICGLEGSNPEHAEAVEALIMDLIEEVAEHGVSKELIESVLHQMEIEQREIRGEGCPYGLQLLQTAIPAALHGGDPIAALDIDPRLQDLRQAIEQPDFIQALTCRWLRDNPHRVRVIMFPDKSLSARQAEETRQRLQRLKASMRAEEKARVIQQAAALAARQQQTDDPNLLPKIELHDVPPELRIPQGRDHPINGIPATWFSQGTNGLVYENIVVELPELMPEQVELVRLYCQCLTEVGVGERDYLAVQRWQAAVSAGLSAHCTVCAGMNDIQEALIFLRLAGHGLVRNQAALGELLFETFMHARFDELHRLQELIGQFRTLSETAVTDYGHTLAMAAACAGIGPAGAINHQWDGLLGLKRLKALDHALKDEVTLAEFAARLAGLHERLIGAPYQLLVVGEARYHDSIEAALRGIWLDHKPRNYRSDRDLVGGAAYSLRGESRVVSRFRPEPVNFIVNQAWVVNTEVNFCARAYPAVPAGHPDVPALMVLGRFLHNGYLHRAIRERGGAYGCGAGFDAFTGSFRFYSYRDPRLAETLEDFDRSLDWLRRHQHGHQQLEEAILGVIRAIDRPSSPAGEAIKAFMSRLNGCTPEYIQRLRQKVLKVSLSDLQRVAETYLVPEHASTAVVSDLRMLANYRELNLEVVTL